MNLTKENIQFIDTYLKNSNVVYIDIRYEMTDHIATAVEEKIQSENVDFYDAFKAYMTENKKEILKNNKSSLTFTWSEIIKFLKFLLNPLLLVFGICLYSLNHFLAINSYFSKDFTFGNLIFLLFSTICIFYLVNTNVLLKKRYYKIEQSGQILFIIYLLMPIVNSKNLILLLFFLYITVGFFFFYLKEIKSFQKHKYNLV